MIGSVPVSAAGVTAVTSPYDAAAPAFDRHRALPDGGGACLHQAGSGTVDYTIPTSGGEPSIQRSTTRPSILSASGAATMELDDGSTRTSAATPPATAS